MSASSEPKRPAVRVWQGAGARRTSGAPPTRKRRSKRPKWAFVFDTETTTDASQQLRVGCFRILERGELVHEGLFYEHATDEELAVLRGYAGDRELTLLSMGEFREWFFHYGYRLRATVVGFSLPFDLSRLAVDWSPARGFFHGGWSMTLWPRRDGQGENTFRPRLRLKAINNRAAMLDFTAVSRDERDGKKGPPWRGRFLDLRTLAAALTDRSLSLDAAAETFGTEHRSSATSSTVDRSTPATSTTCAETCS